jgi:hypothetical protein
MLQDESGEVPVPVRKLPTGYKLFAYPLGNKCRCEKFVTSMCSWQMTEADDGN